MKIISSIHPKGLFILFLTEMWERFSYYGMRALLILYLVDKVTGLGWSMADASALYGTYTSLIYVTPLIGGYLADKFLGNIAAVFLGGTVMALGHLALTVESLTFFYIGLALLIIGNGLFKPNISTMVGNLYPKNSPLKDSAFTIFYMGVNSGAFLGSLICGYLAQHYGWHWGFGAAGVGMVAGLIQLWFGKRHLAQEKAPEGLLSNHTNSEPTINKSLEKRHLAFIAIAALFSMLFFIAFEQIGSSLNFFAERSMNRNLFGFILPAAWFQALNPLFIFLCAPFVSVLWQRLARSGKEPSVPFKYAAGLFLLGCGFLLMALGTTGAQLASAISMSWLIGSYFFLTIAELFISPVGLALVSKLAPQRFAAAVMGGWFLAIALGNKIAGMLAGLIESIPQNSFYWIFVIGSWIAALVLVSCARQLNKLASP